MILLGAMMKAKNILFLVILMFLAACQANAGVRVETVENAASSTAMMPAPEVDADGSGEDSIALIYNGPVAAEGGPEAVATIAEEIGLPVKFVADMAELPALLDEAAILIVGGTEDDLDPLYTSFTPDARAALDTYLSNGGRYLGICGGGFLASNGWYEADGSFVEMLGLIPAESTDYDLENDEPQIVTVEWLGDTHPMYFQAGPLFELTDGNDTVVEVVAQYDDGGIAALISSYGDGKAAVIGPHPEADESWREEAEGGEDWYSTTDLLAALLEDILSERAVGSE